MDFSKVYFLIPSIITEVSTSNVLKDFRGMGLERNWISKEVFGYDKDQSMNRILISSFI